MADQTKPQDNQKTDRPEELKDTQLEDTAGGRMPLNPKDTARPRS